MLSMPQPNQWCWMLGALAAIAGVVCWCLAFHA
jgi:hypothetical protein